MSPRWADTLMDQYKCWLQSVDGKHKSLRCSTQRSRQVLFILKTISPVEFRIHTLFDCTLLRDVLLTAFDKKRKPGTVRTYLGSLKLFYDYLICDQSTEVIFTTEGCQRMIMIVMNWSATYSSKKASIRKWEKQL